MKWFVLGIGLLAVLLGDVWPALAETQSCDPGRAEAESFRIGAITKTTVPSWVEVPLKLGAEYRADDVAAATTKIDVLLKTSTEGLVWPRFRLISAGITCVSMDDAAKSVTLNVRTDRIVVPEGATTGEIIDEANPFRLSALDQSQNSAGFRADSDPQIGNVLGVNARFDEPDLDDEGPILQRGDIGFWKSVDEEFFRLYFNVTGSWWARDPRLPRVGYQLNIWWDQLPYAERSRMSRGFTVGYGAEIQSGRTDLRVNVAFRLNWVNLRGPANIDTTREWGFVGSAQQEYTLSGGFLRTGGWFDQGKASDLDMSFARGSAFWRVYKDFRTGRASWLLDTTVMGGMSSDVPAFRAFIGGNRLDAFLGERVPTEEEFTWAGPIVRGFGIGGMSLPSNRGSIARGGRYGGVSVTLGLPGYVQPLVERVGPDEQVRLQGELDNEFQRTISGMMQQRIDAGASRERALRSSTNEGLKLQRVLENFISRGPRIAIRPILAFDVGRLANQTEDRTTMSVGGGIRIASSRIGLQLLVTDIVHDSLPDGVSGGRELLVRAHLRAPFGHTLR